MHIHIVGVAGTGMGSLAGLLAGLGHTVTGSDVRFDPPIGPRLKDWGVTTKLGFKREHLNPLPDLVVIGNVCRANNEEAVTAFELGAHVTHIAGALQRFALSERVVTVCAGTHGKTTTSSLVAWLLHATGYTPGFFIGGVPCNFDHGFQAAPVGHPFVIEGDEYDTAYFEKTAKFLHYAPHHAIITSLEHDHVDIYPTFVSYLAAFERFAELLPDTGVLLAHAGDPNVLGVCKHARARVVTYGVEGFGEPSAKPVWQARDVTISETGGQHFDIYEQNELRGRAELPLSGLHNVANALAALSLCHLAYGAPLQALCDVLRQFDGTRRRQELLGEPDGVRVYDDFAHHPTAVDTTLRGLRARHPVGRLFAVFEPRSATACRNVHQKAYATAFGAADFTIVAPLGRQDLPPAEQLDISTLVRDITSHGKSALACNTVDEIALQLGSIARRGDTIVVLSNGAFGGLHQRLLKELVARA
jgi:UDP-N-acetylmuramate: L-alanyl-gamma-D-glutamyl-meso-diaminopimelate ligase